MPSPPLSIVQSLSPRIAVLTSEDVVAACEANGCRGLEELLRPWESATDRGVYLIVRHRVLLIEKSLDLVEYLDTVHSPDVSS